MPFRIWHVKVGFHDTVRGLLCLFNQPPGPRAQVLPKAPFTGTVFAFRGKSLDRLYLYYSEGIVVLMIYKRLEETTFTSPTLRYETVTRNNVQFETLFGGLDPSFQ